MTTTPDSPYSDDLKEFFYSNQRDKVAVDTLELRHPAFVDEDGVTPIAVRVVNANEGEDFTGTLEATAPMNAGQSVVFKAVRFDLTLPESNSPGTPTCQVAVDNVGRVLTDQLELAVETPHALQITYRQFLVDDPSEPGVVIDGMSLGRVNIGQRVTGTAGFDDDLNTPFPRKRYTAEEYPGLAR